MKNVDKFYEAMKKWRKVAGLSQEAAAEKIGVSRITVQYWEGKQRPTIPKKEYIEKIIKAYKIDRDTFMKEYALALSPMPTADENEDVGTKATALARMIATTFYSLSPNGFNPVKVNIYMPPAQISARGWVSHANMAFCEAHGLSMTEKLIMDKATEIVMCIAGVIEMDAAGIFREVSKEKMQEVTLDKVYEILRAMKFGSRPGGEFEDEFNKLATRDKKNGWSNKESSKRERDFFSPTQDYIDFQFHGTSQEAQYAVEKLLLALRPFYCETEREMFCGGGSVEVFMNGSAMVVLDGAPEEKFFRKLIANGRPSQFPIPKANKDDGEIVRKAKEEILAMAADIEKREGKLKEAEGKDAKKIAELEARVKYLIEYLSEMMMRERMSEVFKSMPNHPVAYKKELEKLSSEDLDGWFRLKMGLTLKKPEETREKPMDAILSSAYEKYGMEHDEDFDGSQEAVGKINKETELFVKKKINQLLVVDYKHAVEWEEAIKEIISCIAKGNHRKSIIEEAMKEKTGDRTVEEVLSLCEKIGLVEKYISSGRGRPSLMYRLSYLGAIYFATLGNQYKQGLILHEARIDGSTQSTKHHKLVQQMQEVLEKYGYVTEIEGDLLAPDGMSGYRFDLVAKKKGLRERAYIECDLGEGSPMHYREKIDGIFAVTPFALFVTPSAESAKKISNILQEMKGPRTKLKKEGLLWQVVSIEEAKQIFEKDANWPIRRLTNFTHTDKKHGGHF